MFKIDRQKKHVCHGLQLKERDHKLFFLYCTLSVQFWAIVFCLFDFLKKAFEALLELWISVESLLETPIKTKQNETKCKIFMK